jgi:hypothetical protein
MGLGSYTIVNQVQIARDHPNSVNFYLVTAGVALLSTPGVIGAVQVRRGNSETPATQEPPSSSPAQAPQEPSRPVS